MQTPTPTPTPLPTSTNPSNSSKPPSFLDPYDGMQKDKKPLTRLQSRIAEEDYFFIKSLRPRSGTVTTTVNILFHRLVKTLKAHGLKGMEDLKRFEEFMTHCKISSTALAQPEPGPQVQTKKGGKKSNGRLS